MEGPRAPTNQEYNELLNFLNGSLRTQSGWSISDEYPTALTPANIHNLRIIKEQDQILSHAAIRPVIIKTRIGLFKVGCIGSVITRETHRNLGLSQQVMNECLKTIKDQGCDIAILWSDLYDFYSRLGFQLAGTEVSLLLDKEFPGPKGFRITEGNRIDPQALHRVYSQHTVSSVRTLQDFEKYLKIPNSRVYTAWNAQNQLVGYAIEGKGADLQGYIHEWGGHIESLTALFSYIRTHTGKPVTVIAPQHAYSLIKRMESFGAQKVNGHLGMIKITNPASVFSKIGRSARQEWGVNQFVLEQRGNDYFFGIGDQLFKTDREADIVRLIFGPEKPSQIHDCGPQVNAALDKILPVDMWIWGWDSV
ncbi:MAG: GNAT family N-acetyltransferase [Oligoflexia bacterium]|nr:GNAT family N-acetyltransferase [Oligoflexia bacterium]